MYNSKLLKMKAIFLLADLPFCSIDLLAKLLQLSKSYTQETRCILLTCFGRALKKALLSLFLQLKWEKHEQNNLAGTFSDKETQA